MIKNNMSEIINIKIPKRITNKIKEFEKKEWVTADIEHYGKSCDFSKKQYKFVADNNNGEILGFLDLIIIANVAFVETLLVSSKHRREGVGKKLITKAENLAKKKKCTKIWLETGADWKAVKFYEKNNYKVTGAHEKHYFGNKDLIFTKFL
jgi:ribosomal protein S18 acetylase RimI-like enzyme